MFSNDKNVETIGQLVEVLKHYIGLQTEYVKLDVVDKVVRLLTAITMTVVLVGLLAGRMGRQCVWILHRGWSIPIYISNLRHFPSSMDRETIGSLPG